jgi:hypothetical protein
MDHFYVKKLSVEGAPLLGTLEEMLIKALDTDIYLHRGPVGTLKGIRLLELLKKRIAWRVVEYRRV